MHCEYTDDSTDPDGADTIASYAWLFGDGEGSSEKNPSHNYASVGDYPVTLTVTDDHSESDDASLTISVPNGRSTGGTGSLIAKGPPS